MPKVMTRTAAKADGLKTYFTGRLCKHGHVAERLVCAGVCEVCMSAKAGSWARKNPERAKLTNDAWKKLNPMRVKVRKAKYSRKRRLLPVVGSHTYAEVIGLFKRQRGMCAYCQTAITMVAPGVIASEDHIDPVTRGGTDYIDNIALACTPCNSRKKDKSLAAYLFEIDLSASDFERRLGRDAPTLFCEAA
jgi:5-methylcytosine-specific restriction endonuclease McrA